MCGAVACVFLLALLVATKCGLKVRGVGVGHTVGTGLAVLLLGGMCALNFLTAHDMRMLGKWQYEDPGCTGGDDCAGTCTPSETNTCVLATDSCPWTNDLDGGGVLALFCDDVGLGPAWWLNLFAGIFFALGALGTLLTRGRWLWTESVHGGAR